MKERFGIHSIFVKQLICFALGNVIIVLVMTAIFLNAFQLAREEVYDRMNAQSEYYLETLDAQLENIYNLEINFFYDRRLVFLMEERSSLSDYERRDALLSRRTAAGDPGLQQSDPKYLSFYSQYQLYDNAVIGRPYAERGGLGASG